jgi:hypothetical protein
MVLFIIGLKKIGLSNSKVGFRLIFYSKPQILRISEEINF